MINIHKKATVFLALLITALIITAGVVAAQANPGSYWPDYMHDGTYKYEQGDDDVVASVNGIDVFMGTIRKATSFLCSTSPEISEDAAIKQVMTELFKRRALLAEANRLGIDGTEEGYAQYDEIKKSYNDDQEFRGTVQEQIDLLGISEDEYWENALEGYIKTSTIVKLWNYHVSEIGMQNASYEEQWQIRNQYSDELLKKADIVWMNAELESIYNN
jgi:hypothetical protein